MTARDITHAELVARAVRWLRTHQRCRLVLAEMASLAPCTPDAIGWTHNGMTHHVECKVSRSDLLRDKHKLSHRAECEPGNFRWYLLPPGLSADGVDASWGILRADGSAVTVEREAEQRDRPDASMRTETLIMMSVVRRLEDGVSFDARTGRFAKRPRKTKP